MDINFKTTITLSPDDVKSIINDFLAKKGYIVDEIKFNTETVYLDDRDYSGTSRFKNIEVLTNIKNSKETI